ncbi:MAG: hypothetical protein ABIP79_06165 [Chitinophagaceae bacterium]
MLRTVFFIFLLSTSLSSPAGVNSNISYAGEKNLNITVDEIGIISIGRDTVSSDVLARYIQERLFKSYMGTGKMYDKIKLKTDGQVPEMVMEVVLAEIKTGQQRALTELCLQKHKDFFEKISQRQQEKIKKQFPVLFQTTFS